MKPLKPLLIALALTAAPSTWAQWSVDASLEVGLIDAGPMPAFSDGSQGKFRYGRGDGIVQAMSGYVQVQSDVTPQWHAKLALDFNDQASTKAGIIDAYLQYRPLPTSGIRWRVKAGAFRPPISFEHGGDGWATLYTTNASAINSWVGEELGGLGVEISARRDLAASNSSWYWAGSGAVFYGNDPSGTVLSWRGWSINNWQTAWGGEIPLADLPIFSVATFQEPVSDPFLELDDKPGYYVWGELGEARRFRARLMYYDNRAELDARGHGQSGWHTRFAAISTQFALPLKMGLIAQWMDGRTRWGIDIRGRPAVDNDFSSWFTLLTRSFGPHRLTVRRDWMRVDDRDFVSLDPNDESGEGWTLSYRYRLNRHWEFSFEWLQIDSRRPARIFEDEDVNLTEDAWYFITRWQL